MKALPFLRACYFLLMLLSVALTLFACSAVQASPPALASDPDTVPVSLPSSTFTPGQAAAPSIGKPSSLPSCQSNTDLEPLGVSPYAQSFLLSKGSELAGKLPAVFGEWAKKGVELGSGSLTPIQGHIAGFIEKDIPEGKGFTDDNLGEDMSVRLELVLQSPDSGGTRWVFGMQSASEEQPDASDGGTPAVTPSAGNGGEPAYSFNIRAEVFDPDSQQWVAICEDALVPVEPTAQPESATPTSEPIARLLVNSRCREGPSTAYPVIANLSEGEVLQATGRNQNGSWWQVSLPGRPDLCWLSAILVEPNPALLNLPVAYAPSLPTATNPPQDQSPPKQQGCLYDGICHPWVCGPKDPQIAVPCEY